MNRLIFLLVLAAGAPIATAETGDPSLARMAQDIENNYRGEQAQLSNRTAAPKYDEGEWKHSDEKSEGNPGKNALSDSNAVGGAVNTVFSGARNASNWWDASNLLDQEADRHYEPDLSGEGAPDIPATLCGASADCNQCYARAFDGLYNMRFNLEKLRVAGQATSDYVAKSYALGDGLAGVTGVAALQWQVERAGIAKSFEHFKGTYDRKYEEMMKSLKGVLDRWDACEGQYGERDWYARFGFLYYQFMRDKYKRNF